MQSFKIDISVTLSTIFYEMHEFASNLNVFFCCFLGMPNSTCSIRFTYKTNGRLRVLIQHNNRSETVWSVDSLGGFWRRAYVELPSNKSFHYKCKNV